MQHVYSISNRFFDHRIKRFEGNRKIRNGETVESTPLEVLGDLESTNKKNIERQQGREDTRLQPLTNPQGPAILTSLK